MHRLTAVWERDEALFREIAELLLSRAAEQMATDLLQKEAKEDEEAGGVLLQSKHP